MKKKVSKSKSSKKSQAEEPVLPSLVEAMAKIAERLESLERKTDAIMGRLSQQNQPRQHQSQQSSHQFNNHQSSHSRPQHQPNPQSQNRQLYQATCADCQKSCEVPFKPTGERPVYCKECFADRKASKNGNSASPKNASLSHAAFQQRELHVKKHGVGRVRVSEMVPAGRAGSKHRKPAKFAKSKR